MFKNFWYVIKESLHEWSEDKASRLAAALSYYTIFSLAPLLVIVIAIAGLAWGKSAAQGAIVGQIQGLIGKSGAEQVQTMIRNANQPGAGIIATVIGVIVLILGATGVFTALQDAMNTIWEVQPKPGRGILNMVRDRFLSFAMVLGIGFLLIVSLVVTTALSAIGKFMASSLPFSTVLMQAINIAVSLLVLTFLFALIYKFLPDARTGWKEVLLGGLITAILFTVGRQLIGLYLGRSSTASVFGAAGSLIILLLWIYYSGMILFMGAEITQVYATHFGKGIVPAPNAERVTEEMRTQHGIPHRRSQQLEEKGRSPVPQAMPRTAVPARQAVPVPVPVTGQPQPRSKTAELLEAAGPMVVAFIVGLSGSVAIAREQRKRPLVINKGEDHHK